MTSSQEPIDTEVICKQTSESFYHFKIKRSTRRESSSFQDKTLVIMFGWIGATPRAVEKYRQLYHSRGFDVLFIKGKLSHLTWPNNSLALARDINDHLESDFCQYKQYLIHGFSVGGYNFVSCLCMSSQHPNRYDNIRRKTVGIVYDSLCVGTLMSTVNGMAAGASSNVIMQILAKVSIIIYLYSTKIYTINVFDDLLEFFRNFPLEVPCLWLTSSNDPMCSPNTVTECVNLWKAHNVNVTLKMWEKSEHVTHLRHHTDEYVQLLDQHLGFVQKNMNGNKETEVNVVKSKL